MTTRQNLSRKGSALYRKQSAIRLIRRAMGISRYAAWGRPIRLFVLVVSGLLGFVVGTPAGASALGDLAATMNPGEWKELATNGFESGGILVPAGGDGNILEFMDEAQRNPITKKIYIMGCARATSGTGAYVCGSTGAEDAGWIEYDEATNSWRRMPNSPVSPGFHSYDNAALDPATGVYYYREIGGRVLQYTNGQWSRLPDIANSQYATVCCTGFEYFPEAGGLIFLELNPTNYPQGALLRWRPGEGGWTAVTNSVPLSTTGYHVFSEYSAARKLLYVGGGTDDRNRLWMVSPNFNFTRAADAPVSIGHNGDRAVNTVDPVTGNLLVFTGDDTGSVGTQRKVFEYNPSTNQWTEHGSHQLHNGYDLMAAATPIPEYGVVFVVAYKYTNSKVYLYKHSPGGGNPIDTTPPAAPLGLQVQ